MNKNGKIFEESDFSGLSLRECILKAHDKETLELSRRYEDSALKLSRCKNHLIFNLRCKKLEVFPKSLQISCPIKTNEGLRIIERAKRQLIRERVRESVKRKAELEDQKKWLEIGLKRKMGEKRFEDFSRLVKKKEEGEFLSVQKTQLKKLNVLEERKERAVPQPSTGRNNLRWVYNESGKELSKEEKSVLERGLNFAPAPRFVPKLDIIAAIEPALRQLEDKTVAEVYRAKIQQAIVKSAKPSDNVTKQEKTAMRDLKDREDIQIAPADKGNATVVLKREDYVQKVHAVIRNKPFRLVEKDPTKKLEDGLNKLVWGFCKNDKIRRPLYDYLRSSAAPLPRFYGRVKVHKEGMPVRPVISAVGTATYNASSYLAKVLAPLVGKSDYTTKNSREFVEETADWRINEDEVMVSYDVTALYTSLPINTILKITRLKLEEDKKLKDRTPLEVDDIIELLAFCLKSTYFSFGGNFYVLDDGVAMGSPVSSVVANLFMEDFEQKAIASADAKGIAPRVWKRYVDDVFSILKKDRVTPLLDHLNMLDENIKFTTENEEEGRLPFLDVSVQRNGNQLRTGVFRKKTHTNRVLSFNSYHPVSAKKAVVLSLFDRIETHFAKNDEEGREKERNYLYEALRANGYSARFITNTLQRALHKRSQQKPDAETPKATAVIPYVQGLSEQLSRELRKIGIRVVSKSTSWQWTLCAGIKDTVPDEKKKGIVYLISCSDCDSRYVGETKRSVKVRVAEHERHTRSGRTTESAVAEHVWNCDHKIKWDKVKILDMAQNWQERRVKEALHIAMIKPDLNRDVGLELSAHWLDLIQRN